MIKPLISCLIFLITAFPASAQRYIFFLHNAFLETASPDQPHPQHGKCEYAEIIAAFKREGFFVFAELRPPGTDAAAYAKKIAAQVDSLLNTNVSPSHITVIGTSKGARIAQYVSDRLKNKSLNYVFVGICNGRSLPDGISFYGNILSVYESSDQVGSCMKEQQLSGTNVNRFKEVKLSTGLKHGFLYKASSGWMSPAIDWANGKY